MKEKQIVSLLQSADLESVEQIAEQSPVTDDATKQRIWQQIRKRTNSSEHFDLEETEALTSMPSRKLHWIEFGAVVAIAATVLLVSGTAIHTLLQMPSPQPYPGAEITQMTEQRTAADPLQQLSQANACQEDCWQGHVIQAEKICTLALSGVFLYEAEKHQPHDNLQIIYSDPENESHAAYICYSKTAIMYKVPKEDRVIRVENFSASCIGSSALKKPEENGGETYFYVDMQEYYVYVHMYGTSTEELSELISVLKDALNDMNHSAQ